MAKRKEFSTTAQVAVGVVVAFVVLIALITGCAAGSASSDVEDALAGERVVTTGTVRSINGFGSFAQSILGEVRSNGRTIMLPFRGHTHQTPAWEFELTDGSSVIVLETAADCFPELAFERQPSQLGEAATNDRVEYLGQEVRIAYTPLIGVYHDHILIGEASVAECAEGGETISPIPIEYATTEELERAGYRPLGGTVIALEQRNPLDSVVPDLPEYEYLVTLAVVQLWDALREVVVYSGRDEYVCPLNGNGERPMVGERVEFWGMQREPWEVQFNFSSHDTFTCLPEGEIYGLGGDILRRGPPYRKIPPARDAFNDTQTR